jgi:hypothetical protein
MEFYVFENIFKYFSIKKPMISHIWIFETPKNGDKWPYM